MCDSSNGFDRSAHSVTIGRRALLGPAVRLITARYPLRAPEPQTPVGDVAAGSAAWRTMTLSRDARGVAQCWSFPHNGYGLHERLQDPGAWLDVVQQMNASEHILRLTPELEALMPGTVETGLLWMNMPPAQIPRRSRTVRGGPAQTTTSCARVGPSIWTNAPSSSWRVHRATRVYPAARRLGRAIAVHLLHRRWRARSSARPDSPSQRSSWTGSRS
jgi:hypothetical protein